MASETSPKNGQQKATEELQNKDDVSVHCTSDVHEVDENSEVPEKELYWPFHNMLPVMKRILHNEISQYHVKVNMQGFITK